jgi:hypothetical protein
MLVSAIRTTAYDPLRVRCVAASREMLLRDLHASLSVSESAVTTKEAFSPSEWQLVLEGPPAAGLLVIAASHGGTFRETIAMSKAYAEARAQHGESELLDEIVAEKPRVERGKVRSHEELREQELDCLREAATLLEHKATVEERDDYQRFVLAVANKVATAHREGGRQVSPAEEQALLDVTTALDTGSS